MEYMNAKVQILMSTYNGSRYVRTQLDSILAQTHQNLEILVRDDGSSDDTVAILREYENKYENIRVFAEENVGLVKSFLSLLARSDADYVGFSDQDDFWLPQKVEKALEKLSVLDAEKPALYCSNQILVDNDLKEIPGDEIRRPIPGFENAVIESMCTGCTAMMNRALVQSVQEHMPEHAIWHDWWCYLVATYLGTVVFDENAYILYRQHGGNQLGSSHSSFQMMKNKWDFLKKTRGCLKAQLGDFQKMYRGDTEKDALVDLLLASEKSVPARFKLIVHRQWYRQKAFDNHVVRGLILINRML